MPEEGSGCDSLVFAAPYKWNNAGAVDAMDIHLEHIEDRRVEIRADDRHIAYGPVSGLFSIEGPPREIGEKAAV